MQTEDKRSQIKSWFMPEPKLQRGLIILALPFIFLGIFIIIPGLVAVTEGDFRSLLISGFFGVAAGSIGVILGGFTYYAYTKAKARYDARPSTEQMTQWLQEDLEKLKDMSLDKMTLDESETIAESVILKGPIWWAESRLDEEEILRGKTEGQEYLYSIWDLMILHIAENSLAVYSCKYNWPSDQPNKESTSEYFYEDIVRVSTSSEEFEVTVLEKEMNIINPGCVNIGCCGCLGAGCLGYLNPFFVGPLLASQAHQTLKDAFGDSFNYKLPDSLKVKRGYKEGDKEGDKNRKFNAEGKAFKLDLSGGQALTCLMEGQLFEIYGAEEEVELANKAVTTITRRIRDKKAS